MARKIVNRKELRAQSDAAEARGKTKAAPKEKAVKEKAVKDKKAKEPKKAAEKKPPRKKVAKEVRMKAYWGVFSQGMKRLALFEYADKKAADKKVAELIASSRVHHFVQLVKEAISE
jgi:outer membrane biosynthesis protein TonB